MAARKIDLYFFRHGLADWPHWHRPDDERPLNRHGRQQTHQVAAFLALIGVTLEKILTSPLPRASQTAEIAAEHLQAPVETVPELDKRFTAGKLKKMLGPDAEAIMLVGHEPNFSRVIKKLTGGDIKMRKSGVARLRLDRRKMTAQLEWLLSPETCYTEE